MLGAYDLSIGLDTGSKHVGLSDFENPGYGSLHEIWMEVYLREQINEHYRLSFDEWLNRPRWEIMMMLRVLNRRKASIKKIMNDVAGSDPELQNLEKELKLKG